MPKSNSTLVGIPPDPFYDPLPPSVEELLIYKEELDYESPWITYEWATNEIKEHLLNWVRVGLVADKIRYLKLWQSKFRSWQEYCQEALSKTQWQIARTIKAARVTITLACAGFEILPTCEAQASKLVKFLSDPQALIDKWTEVIKSVPKHLITANAIGRVFGEEPKKEKISLSRELKERLQSRADEIGISVELVISDLLDIEIVLNDFPEDPEKETAQEDDEQPCSRHQSKIERWQADLETIVVEHDFQNWLTLVWFKFLVPV